MTNGNGMDTSAWQGLFDQLASSAGDGSVYYLKEKRTRVRLVLPEGQEPGLGFYAETEKIFKGKVSTAFMIWAVVMYTSKDNDQNIDPKRVRAIRVPRTVLQGIVGQLAEGFELFDPKEGHGLTIEKTTSAQDRTAYVVKVSPKPVPVSEDIEWPEKDLEKLAAAEAIKARERDGKRADGDDDEDQPGDRRGRGVGRGRYSRPQAVESDEDLPF